MGIRKMVRRLWKRLKTACGCCCFTRRSEKDGISGDNQSNKVKVENVFTCCSGRSVNVRWNEPY